MIRMGFNRGFLVLYLALGMLLLTSPSNAVLAEDPPSAVGAVMKLFKSGRLPPERQDTVVEMICSRGNENDLRVIFDQLIQPEGFTRALRIKAIGWLSEAASTRKVKPTGDLDSIVQTSIEPESIGVFMVHLCSVEVPATSQLLAPGTD